jgi:hypothetical protein
MTNKEEINDKIRRLLTKVALDYSNNQIDVGEVFGRLETQLPDFFWQEIEQARRERDEEILTDLYRIMGNTAGCGMDDIFLYAQKLGIDLTNIKHQDLTD